MISCTIKGKIISPESIVAVALKYCEMFWMRQSFCTSFNCRLGSMCRNWFHSSGLICDLLLLLLQLLIGFECGVVVLWDLKCKKADYRYNYDEVSHYFPRSVLARLVVRPFIYSLHSGCQNMFGCEMFPYFLYTWQNSSSNVFSCTLDQLIAAVLWDFAPWASVLELLCIQFIRECEVNFI